MYFCPHFHEDTLGTAKEEGRVTFKMTPEMRVFRASPKRDDDEVTLRLHFPLILRRETASSRYGSTFA